MAYTITVLPYERSFDCGEEETVLQAALRQGVLLPYGCKHGGCGRCKAMVLEGDVDPGEPSTYALMDFERQQGFTLLCSSIPESDLVIEVDAGPVDEVFQGAPILDFETEVKDVTTLTHDIRGVRLALIDPPEITFQAGQYVDGLVPGTQEWRSYSMASPPSSRRELEFMVKLMAGGLASSYVEGGLAIGERITVRGPYGSFRLRSEDRPAVMIAGGSGMAPILSMLRDLDEAAHVLLRSPNEARPLSSRRDRGHRRFATELQIRARPLGGDAGRAMGRFHGARDRRGRP
jgi:Na+-transporting NADH:ubiquinone oxidoreductase subunit NqrF